MKTQTNISKKYIRLYIIYNVTNNNKYLHCQPNKFPSKYYKKTVSFLSDNPKSKLLFIILYRCISPNICVSVCFVKDVVVFVCPSRVDIAKKIAAKCRCYRKIATLYKLVFVVFLITTCCVTIY